MGVSCAGFPGDLPRTTECPARKRGDECSDLLVRAAPQSHGRKSVVRGLPMKDSEGLPFDAEDEKANLFAFAEDHGRKSMDDTQGGPSEARRAEEGASADCAEEMKDTTGVNPWRLHRHCTES